MAHHRNILDLPSVVLEHIWKYCNKATLLNLACCSRTCNHLLIYKKYEKMRITWSKLEEEISLPLHGLKFTKSLSFEAGEGIENRCNTKSDWECVCIRFYRLINDFPPSKLESISISSGKSLDGYLLPIFTKFDNLKAITLSRAHLNHGSLKLTLKSLSRLRYLEKLDLSNYIVSVQDFNNIHQLTEVNVYGCILDGVIPSFFVHIARLEKLRIFGFSYNFDSTKERIKIPVENMIGLTSLERLDLTNSIISNQHELKTNLYNMKSLRWLRIRNSELTNSIGHICNLQLLTNLYLDGCFLVDQDIASLLGLPQLYHLDVGYNQFTDDGLMHICQMVSLRELDIVNNQHLTDEGIGYLTTLTSLNKIDIGHCQGLTPTSLIHLSALTSLKIIGVLGMGHIISEDIIDKMKVLKRDWEFETYDHLFQDAIMH